MFGREDKISSGKLTAVQYIILVIFGLLFFGLWRLQVSQKDRYGVLAEQNRVRTVPILAPRGKILDRENRIIVDNYPSFSALLLRDQGELSDEQKQRIALGLNVTVEHIDDRLRRMRGTPLFQPVVLKDDITPDELAYIEAHRNELPQLDTIMVHRRLYPKNGFAAHLIGYVGEVSEHMLNHPRYELYDPGDVVGQSGVEQYYNDILMGQDGMRRVVVNSRGKEVDRLDRTRAVPGNQLRLTIDLDLQIAAEQALEGQNGAIVAMDPRNGEILAMVSRPTFDPNAFAVRISSAEWNRLITDEAKPLLNKNIQAQLAPGSVFKIIMAVAGAEEGLGEMTASCGGGGTFYGRFFKCHLRGGHGHVDMAKSITQSCDVFFYTLGQRLGIAKIAEYATAFGLGKKTGIDLPQEVSGLMPSEQWKIRNFKQKWYAGETISVAIGQGAVVTTPIQLARSIGAIAMGGKMVKPHVAMLEDLEKYKLDTVAYREQSQIHFDQKYWEIITDAMAGVVNPGGTAASAHVQNVDFGGKTGTAQVISNTARAKLGGHKYKDNGWFVGVAPRRSPEIVVSVLVEQGEHGYMAARIAAQVVKAYWEKKHPSQPQNQVATAAKVEVGGMWSEQPVQGNEEAVGAGRFEVASATRGDD